MKRPYYCNNFYSGDLSTVGQTLTQGTKTLNRWFNTSALFERNSANRAGFIPGACVSRGYR
jgi:hypothetical protein